MDIDFQRVENAGDPVLAPGQKINSPDIAPLEAHFSVKNLGNPENHRRFNPYLVKDNLAGE